MISLEQIRLLEAKISRAIELIRVLKDENSTLRKGLDSAQKRMKELETLVEGFKTDQREIESVIVRTLRNLDELEDAASASSRKRSQAEASTASRKSDAGEPVKAARVPAQPAPAEEPEPDSEKGELDIF